MKAEHDYDYDSTRSRPLSTNVIDHRPSLLRSSRQLVDRSPSPTFSRSQKLPMQEIYRSLMQNRPNMNIEKLIVKQRYLENLSKPMASKSSAMAKPIAIPITEIQKEVQRKPIGKQTPSAYRQKNCDGCANKRQLFDKKFVVEEIKTGENNRNACTRPSSCSSSIYGHKLFNNYILEKPSWRFGRQNSASSYGSTAHEKTSIVSSARSHWSTGTRKEPGSGRTRSQIGELNTSLPGTVKTETLPQSKSQNNKMFTFIPKPETLKKIFIVNGSVVSFNGYGFESFTNWFGDETMLRSESKTKPLVHKELDMSGFTNQEINMKLYGGNKLVVEASRPLRGRYPAMRFKDTLLPKGLSVESLIVCRTKSGRLVIEDISRPYSQSGPKETVPNQVV